MFLILYIGRITWSQIAKRKSTRTRQPQEHLSWKGTKATDGNKKGKGTGHPKGKTEKRKENSKRTKQIKTKRKRQESISTDDASGVQSEDIQMNIQEMDHSNPGSRSTLKRLAALEQLIDFDSIADEDKEELHEKDICDPVATALQKQDLSLEEPMVISSIYW